MSLKDTVPVSFTGKNIVLNFLNLHIYIYINKGCNLNMAVIHSALIKKSLLKSFLGLQPSGFRLSQAKHFSFHQIKLFEMNESCDNTIEVKSH